MARAKSVLFQTVSRGNVEPCKKIIASGFPIDAPVIDCGGTLLMHVSAMCDATKVRQIMELNPDVNAQDQVGRTAMHYAARAGNQSSFNELAAMEDIDVDKPTNSGVTPLMMAIESGDIELVASALNANLNPFLKDALGRTAMEYAQQYRNVKGHDMRNLISAAQDQWYAQIPDEADRLNGQLPYDDDHFVTFLAQ